MNLQALHRLREVRGQRLNEAFGQKCSVRQVNMTISLAFLATVISRKRGPSARAIERASQFALSWAAGTLARSLTAMQATCNSMIQDIDRFTSKVTSGWTPPDLSINFHPAAIRVTADFTPYCSSSRWRIG